jgi:periplasmic divalent cation tolerance protein
MAANRKEAEKIGDKLVRGKLSACANIIPGVSSKYWWKGRIETANETLVMVKTTNKLVNQVIKTVKAMHSYEVPEIIALPIIAGSADYLRWIRETVNSKR